MGYNEQQTSLFLLGVLIGVPLEVKQSKRQREKEQEGTYKPILNKVNFNGMDKYRIMKLSDIRFPELRREKIQQYYEGVSSAHNIFLIKIFRIGNLTRTKNLFTCYPDTDIKTMKKKF